MRRSSPDRGPMPWLEWIMDMSAFGYWSRRAEREAIQAAAAMCDKAREAHDVLALHCLRQALAALAIEPSTRGRRSGMVTG